MLDRDQEINVEQFLKLLPAHKCELTIEHNSQRSSYMTVAEWLEHNGGLDDIDPDEWAGPGERAAAIANNELWTVRWYPDTPVGSYRVYGSTLVACLRKIKETDYT